MAIETTQTRGIIITSLGFVLVQLDVSIVNVALARIGADLGGGIAQLAWVVDAYTVAFASLMLSAGALADRAGPRRVFLGGFAVFVAASLICGLAPGRAALIGARALQGVGRLHWFRPPLRCSITCAATILSCAHARLGCGPRPAAWRWRRGRSSAA